MSQIPYSHDQAKLADSGLQLNLPPDLVPKTQYPYFTNAISQIEGRLETRQGFTEVCSVGTTPVHSIFRLNQPNPSILGERLFGISTELWTAPLPAGNVPVQLTTWAYDGTPLSIMAFQFELDQHNWAIIANGAKMTKRKEGYYQQLGLPGPATIPADPADSIATASSAGAGNLTGDYDWRYTYVNPVTGSESNPSPSADTSVPELIRPASNTTPDPDLGGGAFGNPANAQDGNPATYSDGTATMPAVPNASGRWFGWTAATMLYQTLTLYMDWEVLMSGVGVGDGLVLYSTDNGVSWNQIGARASDTNVSRITATASLPPGTDLTQLIIRAEVAVAGASKSATIFAYDFWTVGTPFGSPTNITLAAESANVCVLAPTDPQETAIRLYRRGGTLTDNWYFVGEYPVSSLAQGGCGAGYLQITDNSSDESITAANTLDLDNDMPVTSVTAINQTLVAIWGYDERILGVGDPARPDAVYFSKRGFGDAWPPQNWISVAESGGEAMNGLVWALRCFVFSRERMFVLVPYIIQGTTFTPQETSCRRGLRGRWALCVGERGIYFVAKDGIYITQGGEEKSVMDDSIRPLFPTFDKDEGATTNGYDAVDMTDQDGLRLTYHAGEVWFDYTGLDTGLRHRLIYDERRNRWRSAVYTPRMQMAYSEPGVGSSLLFGSVAGAIEQSTGLTDNTVAIAFNARTGSYDQGVPLNLKEYGGVAFDIDPGTGSVTITPYINGNATPEAALVVTGTGRQRAFLSLSDVYALNISFDITWSADASVRPVLYQLDIFYRFEPAAVRHWEVPPTTLGIQGWFHVRDAYVTIRSAADVTMTITPDNGAVQTFTLASTSGAKRKLYVPFAANKLKLIQIALDSASDFRVYAPETELRAKQWVTKLGYQVFPVIGAEVGNQTLDREQM